MDAARLFDAAGFMDAAKFMINVSLIERLCILLFLISWCWTRSPYSKLEAFMATVLCAVINWCYFVLNPSYVRVKIIWGFVRFQAYWSGAFWVERYALVQLLLVCWFPISDAAASPIVGVSALFVFVGLPLLKGVECVDSW